MIRTVLYYAGHIVTVYFNSNVIDIFKVNGPLVERLTIEKFITRANLKL